MASEKFLKRLVGKTEVEDALERLNTLTKEETLMAMTKNLEVTHHVDSNVTAVKEIVLDIDGNVEAIKGVIRDVDGDVKETKGIAEGIDGNVKGTKDIVENIDDNVKVTKALAEDVGDNVKAIQGVACSVDHNVKATKHGTRHFLSAFMHVSTLLNLVPKTVTEKLERSFHSDGVIVDSQG